MLIRRRRRVEGKHSIDDRREAIDGDGPVHLFEHLAIPDEDAVQASSNHHQRRGIGVAVPAGEESNQTDLAASDRIDRASVPAPPISRTQSTPRPDVSFLTSCSHSGVCR